MIAYNHYIEFNPALSDSETGSPKEGFVDRVQINESSLSHLPEDLIYEIPFFSNQGRDIVLHTERDFSRTQKGQLWVFEVKDVVSFLWRSGYLTLEYIKHDHFTEKLLKYWSLHIVLPVFFTVEEKYDFLHAGAVEVGGNPILFTAQSFGGKSTMTDYFMKKGHRMISDDKVAIKKHKKQYFVIPSHPFHRPHRQKEDLGLFVKNFFYDVKPIKKIYVLVRVEASEPIRIVELHGIEKFKSLRLSSEINLTFLMPKRFTFLTDLAKNVQVFKVNVPWSLDRINEVYSSIIKQIGHNA